MFSKDIVKVNTLLNFSEPLNNHIFLPEGGRACFYFLDYLLLSQYVADNRDWPFGDHVNVVSNFKDHSAKWFRINDINASYASKHLEAFINKPNLAKKLLKYLNKRRDFIINILKKGKFRKLDNEDLGAFVEFVVDSFYKVLRPSSIVRIVDLGIIAEFKKTFADTEDHSAVVSASKNFSWMLIEEMDLLNLAIKIKNKRIDINSKFIIKELNKIVGQYCFSELGYYNEKVKTLDFYKNKLKIALDNNPELRLKDIQSSQKETIEKRRKILNKFDSRTNLIADIASDLSYIKDCYKFSMNKVFYNAEALFSEIAKRLNKPVDYIKDLSSQEIRDALCGKELDSKMVSERVKNHILIAFENKLYLLLGDKADQFRKKYLEIDTNKTLLNGRCASKGAATGKAKIVKSPEDFHKMEAGDILVVMNTSPDFTPIMEKAGAIVAEEGGLTAHVSIVSRELGIPAVVGVHHAIEILKDGDMLEVDANQGTVKKI